VLQITTPPDVTRQKALEILLSIISFRSSGTEIMTLDQRFLKYRITGDICWIQEAIRLLDDYASLPDCTATSLGPGKAWCLGS
jgi:hypothetical protein